jgi:hypothetical protein
MQNLNQINQLLEVKAASEQGWRYGSGSVVADTTIAIPSTLKCSR